MLPVTNVNKVHRNCVISHTETERKKERGREREREIVAAMNFGQCYFKREL